MSSAEAFLGVAPTRSAPPSATAFLSTPAPAAPASSPWSLSLINQHAGPGQITSAQRSAATNARVGGSPTSSHLTGSAFDFVPQDPHTARAAKALAAAGIPYDQIIDEGDHVHIGWGPKLRNQFKPRGGVQRAVDFLGSVGAELGSNLKADYNDAVDSSKAMMAAGGPQFMEGSAEEFLAGPLVNPKNPARVRQPGEMAAKVEDPFDSVIMAPGRRTGTLSLPETPAAPKPGLKEGLVDAASAVQSILAPATKGEGRTAAGTIRRAAAESDLLAARSARTLVASA